MNRNRINAWSLGILITLATIGITSFLKPTDQTAQNVNASKGACELAAGKNVFVTAQNQRAAGPSTVDIANRMQGIRTTDVKQSLTVVRCQQNNSTGVLIYGKSSSGLSEAEAKIIFGLLSHQGTKIEVSDR